MAQPVIADLWLAQHFVLQLIQQAQSQGRVGVLRIGPTQEGTSGSSVGGASIPPANGNGSLNDLWVYTPATTAGQPGTWVWVKGSPTGNANGIYGDMWRYLPYPN